MIWCPVFRRNYKNILKLKPWTGPTCGRDCFFRMCIVLQLLYLYLVSDRQAWANPVDLDQMPQKSGIWSGITLFAGHPTIFKSHQQVEKWICSNAWTSMVRKQGDPIFRVNVVLFFLFGFYGPFKNISLTSSRSFIKSGRKLENPGKNHLTIHKQNLAFPHVTRARLELQWWETYGIKSQLYYPLGYGGPQSKCVNYP